MQMRILTYNIRHGCGMDGRVDIGRIESVVRSSDADIICLQEVDRCLPRSSFVHQSESLASVLGFDFYFHANFGVLHAGMGNAVLSRFPLYSTWNTSLPFLGEPRGLLHCVANTGNVPLHVFCTHWGLTPGQRRQQSRATLRQLRQISGPAILCGDLNSARSSIEVDSLIEAGTLTDSGPASENTFTSDYPVVKIDYILASPGLTLLSSRVIESDASDHLPVVADFAFA